MSNSDKDAACAEQQIAALREVIRRAGRSTGLARRMTTVVPVLLSAGAAFWSYFWTSQWRHPDPHPWEWRLTPGYLLGTAIMSGGTALPVLAVSIPAACALAASYRGWRVRCARHALTDLDPEARAEVLVPMQGSDHGDTRRIVEALTREFSARTEVAPAAGPDARGDEPSPAEKMP